MNRKDFEILLDIEILIYEDYDSLDSLIEDYHRYQQAINDLLNFKITVSEFVEKVESLVEIDDYLEEINDVVS